MWLGEPAPHDWEWVFAPIAREHLGAPLSAGSSTDVPGDAAQRGRTRERGREAEAREPGREPCDSQGNGLNRMERVALVDLYATQSQPRQQEQLWAESNEDASAYVRQEAHKWMQNGCPMSKKGFPGQSAEHNGSRHREGQAATPARPKTFAQQRDEEEGGSPPPTRSEVEQYEAEWEATDRHDRRWGRRGRVAGLAAREGGAAAGE